MNTVAASLFALVVAAAACQSEVDPYRRALAQLADAQERRGALLVIRKYWGVDEPLPPVGIGPRAQTPEDLALRERLLDVLHVPVEGTLAVDILIRIRAPGFDERLHRCATSPKRYLDAHSCLRAILVVADDQALRALVPLLDGPDGTMMNNGLRELGRRSIPYFRLALQREGPAACELSLFSLRGFLARDEDVVSKKALADPRLREDALAALHDALLHPAWRCRAAAVGLIVEFDAEHRAERLAALAEDASPAVREAVREGVAGRAIAPKPIGYREPSDDDIR